MCLLNCNTKKNKYKHITYAERTMIETWYNSDHKTKKEIAQLLHKSERTIRREINRGTIDAMVSSLVNTGVTPEQQKYLTYTVNYSDGTIVAEKQLLAANQMETIKVRVEFKKDITAADLPTIETTLNLTFSLNYIQADDSAMAIAHPVCKRATTLHTEVCNQTSNYCAGSGYAVGDTITYGNLGITGILASGDAFDCDVNGDGLYDSETERFYYVSGKDGDVSSEYATLIYYNNVSSGEPDNTKGFPYKSFSTPGGTVPGASAQLPTASQWPNVQGIGELTLSRASSACGLAIDNRSTAGPDGELDSCQYLMENTQYSSSKFKNDYWLGTTGNGSDPLIVYGRNRYIMDSGACGGMNVSRGVRPVIEVLKSKISY